MQYSIINWLKLVAEKRLKLAELPETSIVFLPPGAGKRSFHASLFAFCPLSNTWLYARAPPRCYRSPGSAERAGHSARLSCSPLMSGAFVADRVPNKTLSTRRSICTSTIVPALPVKHWLAPSSSTTKFSRLCFLEFIFGLERPGYSEKAPLGLWEIPGYLFTST